MTNYRFSRYCSITQKLCQVMSGPLFVNMILDAALIALCFFQSESVIEEYFTRILRVSTERRCIISGNWTAAVEHNICSECGHSAFGDDVDFLPFRWSSYQKPLSCRRHILRITMDQNADQFAAIYSVVHETRPISDLFHWTRIYPVFTGNMRQGDCKSNTFNII